MIVSKFPHSKVPPKGLLCLTMLSYLIGLISQFDWYVPLLTYDIHMLCIINNKFAIYIKLNGFAL